MRRMLWAVAVAAGTAVGGEAADPAPVDVKPEKVVVTMLDKQTTLAVSPDGRTVGVYGTPGKSREDGTTYFDLAAGKPVGKPWPAPGGPGRLRAGGKTAVYLGFVVVETDGKRDTQDQIMIHTIGTGKDAPVPNTQLNLRDGHKYAVTPDGRVVVLFRGLKLAGVHTADGSPAFPPAESPGPALAVSDVFADGTRVASTHESGKLVV